MGDLVGTLVSDRYELERLLGHGGQGVVYRAFDRTEGRPVAVKILPFAAARHPEQVARLAREQQALVALAGTSAVAVYDLCEAPNGAMCLVMELLEGEDLERHLEGLEDRSERMPLPRLASIAEPVVDTLERAHDAGILHRDLKPGNVFLLSEASGGGARLLDFGLSRMRTATPLTAAGTVLGSPSYIAPEVWKGRTEDLDHRVDVYSLAVILFRALAGRLPFEVEGLDQKLIATTTAPRPSLHALRRDLPRAVDGWVQRALAIDRAERYADVRSLWNGLLRALDYAPPPRAPRPVADSLVNAWRRATVAFRRFIAAGEEAESVAMSTSPKTPPPAGNATSRRVPPPLPVSAGEEADVDEGWTEVSDDDLLAPPSAHASPPSSRVPAAGRPSSRPAPPPRRASKRPSASASQPPAPSPEQSSERLVAEAMDRPGGAPSEAPRGKKRIAAVPKDAAKAAPKSGSSGRARGAHASPRPAPKKSVGRNPPSKKTTTRGKKKTTARGKKKTMTRGKKKTTTRGKKKRPSGPKGEKRG